jgi:hypothetical protein
VLRRLVVFPLLLLLLVSPLLWNAGPLYQAATVLQFAFYLCGLLGLVLRNTPLGRLKLFTIPFFFCMVNTASLIAAINLIRGHRIDFWEPRREGHAPANTTTDAAQQPSVVSDRGQAI